MLYDQAFCMCKNPVDFLSGLDTEFGKQESAGSHVQKLASVLAHLLHIIALKSLARGTHALIACCMHQAG